MVAAIITVCLSFQKSNAASLSIKSIKVAVGKKATINLYNNDGEVKWTSSNKKIKIVKKKSDKVTIKGVKEGLLQKKKLRSTKYRIRMFILKRIDIQKEVDFMPLSK